jgi:hypothetical protein
MRFVWVSICESLWFSCGINMHSRSEKVWVMKSPNPRLWDIKQQKLIKEFIEIYAEQNTFFEPQENETSWFGKEFYRPTLLANVEKMNGHLKGSITLSNPELVSLWQQIFLEMDIDNRWVQPQRQMIKSKSPARIVFDTVVGIGIIWFIYSVATLFIT